MSLLLLDGHNRLLVLRQLYFKELCKKLRRNDQRSKRKNDIFDIISEVFPQDYNRSGYDDDDDITDVGFDPLWD